MIHIFLTHPRDISGVYNRMTTQMPTTKPKIKAVLKGKAKPKTKTVVGLLIKADGDYKLVDVPADDEACLLYTSDAADEP